MVTMYMEKHLTDKKYKNGILGKRTQNYVTLSKEGEERRHGRKSAFIVCLAENRYYPECFTWNWNRRNAPCIPLPSNYKPIYSNIKRIKHKLSGNPELIPFSFGVHAKPITFIILIYADRRLRNLLNYLNYSQKVIHEYHYLIEIFFLRG